MCFSSCIQRKETTTVHLLCTSVLPHSFGTDVSEDSIQGGLHKTILSSHMGHQTPSITNNQHPLANSFEMSYMKKTTTLGVKTASYRDLFGSSTKVGALAAHNLENFWIENSWTSWENGRMCAWRNSCSVYSLQFSKRRVCQFRYFCPTRTVCTGMEINTLYLITDPRT